jgi:hypothetical protein
MTTDTIEHTNGHHPKGRAAPGLPMFTFPDSGITVGLRRFAPDTQDQIARAIQRETPPPALPMVETELGAEPNPADPDYQTALSSYMQQIVLEVSRKLIDLALRRMEVTVDQDAVAALREDMAAIGTPIDDTDDRMVYIRHICISSTYDLTVMMAYLQRRSLPTEVAVQEFLESFQRPISGA